jgi:hypothetical protein
MCRFIMVTLHCAKIYLKADIEIISEATAKIVMYMCICRQLNSGQNHNIKRTNISFEKVVNLKYIETAVTKEY